MLIIILSIKLYEECFEFSLKYDGVRSDIIVMTGSTSDPTNNSFSIERICADGFQLTD